MVSVTITQLCYCNTKAAIDAILIMGRFKFQQNVIYKISSWPDLASEPSLPAPALECASLRFLPKNLLIGNWDLAYGGRDTQA